MDTNEYDLITIIGGNTYTEKYTNDDCYKIAAFLNIGTLYNNEATC